MTANNPLGTSFDITMSNVKENNLMYMQEFLTKTKEVIESGSYILGKKVEEFENKFSQYLNMPYCVAVSSGTSALELVFSVLNLSEEDEIVIQANAYIACAFGTLRSKAKLKIVDCELDGTFSITNLKNAITNHTKAVLVVHLYGDCCNMEILSDVCRKNNLLLIEDCAQSLGSEYNSKKLGSFGDFSCHSFYPTKNLGAIGDAGAIVFKNQEYIQLLKKHRNLGSTEKYKHDLKGTNSRMDALQSVFLLTKMKDLDTQINLKRNIAKFYSDNLNHIHNIDENIKHSYHLFVILTDNRDSVMKHLSDNGIETLIHYPIPFYKSKAFQEYNSSEFKNAEFLASNILSIPIHTSLSVQQQEKIVKTIKKI
jgi:dTDP-4-amino-4,6-dideoxygalactose transaminase